MTLSATVWEEKFRDARCVRESSLQLEPRKFKHDGIAQEVCILILILKGRVLIEIAVESEREDAVLCYGKSTSCIEKK